MADWGQRSLGEALLCVWTDVPYVGAIHGKLGAFIGAGHAIMAWQGCLLGRKVWRHLSVEDTKLPEVFVLHLSISKS
ncbi:hypothetical protein CPB85DRAFT_1346672 [Mucidula mucida]|nr:hypothetical protein CPB85DRAFT_1346672 [Mucidula mucida]